MERLGGCGEEPNIRTSSEFIYVEETKQLMQKDVRRSFFFFPNFCKIFIPDRPLQQRWSAEEIVHPKMVEVISRSRLSSTEKQVTVRRRGGKLKCVLKARQVAGWEGRGEESGVIGRMVSRSESEHCVSKLLSAAIKLFSITKCALCTYVSISLCQQHDGKLCSLRLTHCKYTHGLKEARQIT